MGLVIKNIAGSTTVTLPTVKYSVGGAYESITKTLASGKIVEEMKGYRPTITAFYGYLPAATMTALTALLKTGTLFKVTYIDTGGTTKTDAVFKITHSPLTVFKFIAGVPFWCNVTLTLTAQSYL